MWFRPIKDLYDSFKLYQGGFSGRKLMAFSCQITALYICVAKLPDADKIYGVIALLICSLLCFGIVTWQQVVEFKNGSTIFKKTVSETEIKTETQQDGPISNV